MLVQALYIYLVLAGLTALALITPALRASTHWRTTGRLMATLCVLSGLVSGGGGRVVERVEHLAPPVWIGIALIDVGLTLYCIYLPERGVLTLLDRWRDRRGGRGGVA